MTAQESPAPAKDKPSLQELAKQHKNPFAQAVTVPFLFITGFGVGAERRSGESMNIQPNLPFSLTSDWTVIAQPSLSVTYEPPPDEAFGLQDLQLSLFLTPTDADRWIWGIGPIFLFPTATATGLGTGKWSAGPTGALAYSNGPWFNGVLVSHLWSFGGDPDRVAVNLTSFEILVSYNFPGGWYAQFDPVNSYDWTADSRNAWTCRSASTSAKCSISASGRSACSSARTSSSSVHGRAGLDRARAGPVFVPDGQVGESTRTERSPPGFTSRPRAAAECVDLLDGVLVALD